MLVFKSLWRQRRLFGIWTVSLCAAVTALVIVDIFRVSLTVMLMTQGRKLLSADVAVSVRRAFTEGEAKTIASVAPRLSHATEMFAMVSTGVGPANRTRLGEIRFIDDVYPLVGDLEIESGGAIEPGKGVGLSGAPSAWIAPDWLTLMKLNPGDTIRIGQARFKVSGVIRRDSTQTIRIGNMAPRIYVHRKYLDQAKLIQFGSTFTESFFIAGVLDPVPLKEALEKKLEDPAIHVTTPADMEQGSFRVLSRLLDFLGLAGLVTLCLGWVGVYYLGRRWLTLETGNAGILKCLGYTNRETARHLLIKLLLIMSIGIFAGALLAWTGAKATYPYFRAALPPEFVLTWGWPTTLLLFLTGPVVGWLLLWPAIRKLASTPALPLLQARESELPASGGGPISFALGLGGLFFLLTLAQAHSWRVTLIFLGALSGTIVAIGFFSLAFLAAVKRRRTVPGWVLHLSFSQWIRRPGLTALLIGVSALAGLLAQLVPNLERTLVSELQHPPGENRPALFMFDIQDEQSQPLHDFLRKNGITVSEQAPFVRARILQVNGKNYERSSSTGWKTREEEADARFRNRGVNLSYHAHLSPSESIIAGRPWADMKHDAKESDISVEEWYADRVGLTIGDVLQFDVEGVEFNGRVASLREVDWDSFDPNFFIEFPDGVLNEAPKTWIMTLSPDPRRTPAQMQALIASQFPNMTSINVKESMDVVADLFAKLGAGLKLASSLCLALGIFVFLMILVFQMASARRDWLQLKVLGLRARDLTLVQIVTYGGLCLAGVLVGSLLSIVVAAALSHFAFHAHLKLDWPKMLTVLFTMLGAALAGILLNRKFL